MNDNQGVDSLLTGLTQGITKYLDIGNEFKMENFKNQQKNTAALNLKTQESALDINKGEQVAKYKTGLEDQLSPDMAETALPGYGAKMVNDYNSQHKDNPLKLKDGIAFLKQASDSLNPDNSKEVKQQDKLEKDYADRRAKVYSNRTGGLGLQDAKVNQAIDLRGAVNQFYHPETDKYVIPPNVHGELIVGLDRLLSPGGQVNADREKEIKQDTLREGAAKTLIKYGLASPEEIGGPTQDVSKLLVHMIDRQGSIAERLRNHYEGGLKGLVPSGLESKRVDHVNKADLTNSFTQTLNDSPDYQKHKAAAEAAHPVGKVLVVNSQGQKGYIPAGQLHDALQAGYKQAE